MHSYRIPVTSLQLALVLIPKSMATELPVLGNTSGKTSTTKLRKYRLAESLITVTDDGIAGSSLDHKIFSFPILAYVNFMLTNFKSTLCKSLVGNNILLLNLGGLIDLPFLLPRVDLKKF